MAGNTKEQLTDWSAKERDADLAWINENSHILALVAQSEYNEWGRGVVFVNTDKIPEEAEQSYGYLTLSELEEFESEEVLQIVGEYDPHTEMVVSLVKFKGWGSAYQVSLNSKD